MAFFTSAEFEQRFANVSLADLHNQDLLEGVDESGTVRYFADEDGFPHTMSVEKNWRNTLSSAELGIAIIQARDLSIAYRQMLRLRLADDGMLAEISESEDRALPPTNSPQLDFTQRMETILEVVAASGDYVEAVGELANERSDVASENGLMSVTAMSGQPMTVEFDQKQLQFATSQMLEAATNEVLRSAASRYRQATKTLADSFPQIVDFLERTKLN